MIYSLCLSLFLYVSAVDGGGIYPPPSGTTLGIAYQHKHFHFNSILNPPSSIFMTQRHAKTMPNRGNRVPLLVFPSRRARLRSGRTFSFHAKVFSIVLVPPPPAPAFRLKRLFWWWVFSAYKYPVGSGVRHSLLCSLIK